MISLEAGLEALTITRQALSAALKARDFDQATLELAKLGDALLETQSAALRQTKVLFELQQQHLADAKQIKELQEAVLERARYSLYEVSERVFVYRSKASSEGQGGGEPGTLEPEHYVCQPCFDKGLRVVLQRWPFYMGARALRCPGCGAVFPIVSTAQDPQLPATIWRQEPWWWD
ncbi:hypothetical protein QLQ15_17825 [Lysobacter sp. LF1]|uniref:Uncharacterized protein n=1 Tax=Lysobacter stagni TaxID=3045172 RepID=A0ABT6XL37_9GAMM|nr:hypothetical protein [Lysobacter sp. LF1]MDI9240766.1 hypothetical protein [Lysobacter sp. LF1]